MIEFRLIVAGGRDFKDYLLLLDSVTQLAMTTYAQYQVSIVSGMAPGADRLAVQFAKRHEVQLYEFPADWDGYGKAAGFIRNKQMAEFSHGLLAFWNGESKGTAHMIKTMQDMNRPVHIVKY